MCVWMSIFSTRRPTSGRAGLPHRRRRLRHGAALLARAERLARVEVLDDRLELGAEIVDVQRRIVEDLAASLAVPAQGFRLVRLPESLDDHPDRPGLAHRAVRDQRGQEEDVALADRDVAGLSVLDDAEHDVAFDLVE